MRFYLLPAIAFFLVLAISSCEKGAGQGGTSSIEGKLKVYDLNGIGDTIDEYWGMDEDIFIIYGEEDQTYDDKTSCSYDGTYRFDNLTPGKYTLFTYTDCDTCPDLKRAVKVVVDIVDKKTEYTAPQLVIYE